jgi:hypothetical protein
MRQSTCAIEVLLKLEAVSIAAAENGFPISRLPRVVRKMRAV